jgi:aldose 1-epimerase
MCQMRALSGEHFTIEYQDLSAMVTSVGATLRELTRDAVPVLWSQDVDALPAGSSGQVLAPWPNRLASGTYSYNGISAKAPLDEPEKGNAIHGLVRWLEWKLEYHERSRVKLSCTLAPQPAYPFLLSLALTYELGPNGLTVRVQAESHAGSGAPFGIGFHPYFLAPIQGLAGSRLVVPATRHLSLDARGIPTGEVALDAALTALATGEGIALDDQVLDDCFTGLVRDEHGVATVRFLPGTGPIAEVTIRLDRHFGYVMCYTGDTLAASNRRRAVAIEPMTCPPNALSSGVDVVALDQTTTFDGQFSVSVV